MNILEAFEKSDIVKRGEGLTEQRIIKTGKGSIILSKSELFAADWEPVIEPLTFERIKRECVPGETLLDIGGSGVLILFLGFTRAGEMVTDTSSKNGVNLWEEHSISHWQISSEKWRG